MRKSIQSIAFLVLLLPAVALMAAGGSEEWGGRSHRRDRRGHAGDALQRSADAGRPGGCRASCPRSTSACRSSRRSPGLRRGDVVGTYGGTFTVFHTNDSPWNDLAEETETGGYFGRMVKGSLDVVPSMAKALEFSDDAMALTVHLREGLKWSDGHPMTADDVVFMYEALHFNDLVPTWNWIPQIRRAIKIDDYTVRLETDVPYVLMYYKMSTVEGGGWNVFHPKHYLEKWHIEYNPDAAALAKEEGFEVVGQGVPPPLLVEPAQGPGQADPPPVDHDRGHRHRKALRAQPLLLGSRPGRQPAPLRRRDPGADRRPGDLPFEDYFR